MPKKDPLSGRDTRILAFDPGGTTGWCRHIIHKAVPGAGIRATEGMRNWEGGQFSKENHHAELYRFLIGEQPSIVVYEAFNYQIRKLDGLDVPGVVLMSREYIGVIRLYCQMTKTPIFKQQPSIVGKGGVVWCKDPALKTLGLHTAGEPHHNDATRHLLYFLVQTLNRTDYLAPLRS